MIPSDVTVTRDDLGHLVVRHPECVSGRVIPETDITEAVVKAEDTGDQQMTRDYFIDTLEVECRHCGDRGDIP